jgi:DNA (cytosine-5)-methyltransferase 1
MMRYIELFAGIGGFRLGLEMASNRYKCVFANEWLEKPRRIYAKNFGEFPDPRDVRTITADDVPDADLIVGGFPCATFSIAGKRTGFHLDDTRGTLCFEMFRIARDKRIPYILFENVKGLLNHDRGRTFQVILSALDEMGYDAQWELLDSQNFGVPQHRERIFLIANLRGKSRPKVFPITEKFGKNISKNRGEQAMQQGLFSNISPTLDAHYYKGGASRQYVNQEGVTQYRRGNFRDYKSDGVPTLTANMGTGGHNVPFLKLKDATTKGFAEATIGDAVNLGFPDSETRRGRVSDVAHTLMAGGVNGVVDEGLKIRKLTPLECERLQGLPDNWTKYALQDDGSLKLTSDAERYERCGRTVTSTVIEAIGRKLINV